MTRAVRGIPSLVIVALTVAGPHASAQDVRERVCAAVDGPPRELAARVTALDASGRAALLDLAAGTPADARCGLAALAAVRDPRVVPLLVRVIAEAPADPDVWRLVRWAAFVAGGPEPALAAPFVPLLSALDSPAARRAAGDDRVRLLGELDDPQARDRLVASLDETLPDGTVDAAIHALARQREPRARARVVALGAEGAVAFYLLALAPDTQRDGLAHLARLSPQDQADTVAWAAQTLCEAGVRHPDARAAVHALRASLLGAAPAGVAWSGLERGTFTCAVP